MSFLIEGLDNNTYSFTCFYPNNCAFKDRSVRQVCSAILGDALGQPFLDEKREKVTSYWDEVICEGKPTKTPLELKERMQKWLEKRRNLAPWEIQYEVLKWGFDKRTADQPQVQVPGTNTGDFDRYYNRATKDIYRQMQAVKEAKRSIQFSVADGDLDRSTT